MTGATTLGIDEFVQRITAFGSQHHREFPWRPSASPYAALVSEVMLQQTQTSRVIPYFLRWMETFPDAESLADAPLVAVLELWQGLGYNRRAVLLKQAAEQIVIPHRAAGLPGGAKLPADAAALRALPGIGPATAAGVLAFGFGKPAPYLETNVRTVFLHEFFPHADNVPDSAIRPLVEHATAEAERCRISPAVWNYALLDYGAHLKRTTPNPSRRSAHHARQARFEGSRRQKRAWLLRAVIQQPGLTVGHYANSLEEHERGSGRVSPPAAEFSSVVAGLIADGLLVSEAGRLYVA